MALTENQIELLKRIKAAKRKGDVAAISKIVGREPNYVSMVLNPESTFFNQAIVDAAVKLITDRERSTLNHLKKMEEQITISATVLQ